MTYFITGGTSSIGRVLIKELAKTGAEIRVLARAKSNRGGLNLPGVMFVMGDVTDAASVRQGMLGCERVVHMAALVGQSASEDEWWRVNRDGSRNVLQAACDKGVHSLVMVSSLSVLGTTEPGEVADESRPINEAHYLNFYQKTKRAADQLARDFAGKGLPVKIVYQGFGYGCSFASSHPSFQDQTLLRMAAGKPVVIMGSGKNPLFVAYYNDTVKGILAAGEKGKIGDDYILGNASLNFVEIWAVIAKVLAKKPPRLRVPLPVIKAISALSEILTGKVIFPSQFLEMVACNWNFSSAKAQTVLDWHPQSFETSMEDTWREYQAGKLVR